VGFGWLNPKLSNAILRSLGVIPNFNSWLQNMFLGGAGRENGVIYTIFEMRKSS